jgi:hypothetical protein
MTLVDQRPGIEGTAPEPAHVLFPEARERRRRRWLASVALVVVVVAGPALAMTVLEPGTPTPQRPARTPSLPTGPITDTGAAPQIAWADYFGQLHLGALAGLTERVVARADADPTASLVSLDHTIFWVRAQLPNGNQTVDPISHPMVQGFDTTTGRAFTVAPGMQVIASLDRTFLYVETDVGHLSEYWPNGVSRAHILQLPNGWYLSDPSLLGDPTPVVADGILVESTSARNGSRVDDCSHAAGALCPATSRLQHLSNKALTLGIWDPATGHVRVVGRVWKVIGSYTRPGARSSLVAWAPASCENAENCSLHITDTATLSTRLVHSPLGHGFDWGGGFSPDGTQLAVFVRTAQWDLSPTTELALVSGSGSIRVVPGALVNIGDALAWAEWYPDSINLIAGGVASPDGVTSDNHYVVDAQTGSVVPFRFVADGSGDVNFSVVPLS